jgi:kynurenine formamidase
MNFPYKMIDLTHTLESSIPTWDGGCGFKHDVHIDYIDCQGEDKFRVMKIRMNAGIGTHIDAPSHCIADRKCIHDLELNDLIMPCIVIDISHKCDERSSLKIEDIRAFEDKHGQIEVGSCVMVKTGWSKFWDTPLKYHNNHVFPSICPKAGELLLEREVSAIGIDTLSPDRPEDGFKIHKKFLSANKIIIENVANLDSIPEVGSIVMVLPIKIKEATEAPVRLVGLVKKSA